MNKTRQTLQYASTKTYTHEEGLSCCFRQPGAQSHCRFLHGYALKVSFEFRATKLDPNNWVVDFGNLKEIKQWLKDNYDHKLLVTENDPEFDTLVHLSTKGVADVRIVEFVGCEGFATEILEYVSTWVLKNYGGRVWIYSCTVAEHGGNSGIVYGQPPITAGATWVNKGILLIVAIEDLMTRFGTDNVRIAADGSVEIFG